MLPKLTLKTVEQIVEELFDTAKASLLGVSAGDNDIVVGSESSLIELYSYATEAAGGKPNPKTVETLKKIATSYIEAAKERAKAQILKEADALVRESASQEDVASLVGERIGDALESAKVDLQRILDAESTTARNLGSLEGISKLAEMAGVDDPTVYFVVVRDPPWPCDECKRLHLLEDEVTPRVWRMSELKHGYHKKGETTPSVCGLHPHCQCTLAACPKGYGFVGGKLTFVSEDHDELASQRS